MKRNDLADARGAAVRLVLPPAPRCRRCLHPMCPCCLSWCDTLCRDGAGDDFELCCDGQCDVDGVAVEYWADCCAIELGLAATLGDTIEVAEGPELPPGWCKACG